MRCKAITSTCFGRDLGRVSAATSTGRRNWQQARRRASHARPRQLVPATALHTSHGDADGLSVVDAHDVRGRPIWLMGPGWSDERISHVSRSGDGERVLSASDSGARAWDWRTETVLTAVRPESRALYVEESGDGSTLLTEGGRLRTSVVQVWDISTESELARVEAGRGERLEARFIAQRSRFVVRRLRSRPREPSPWIWDSGAGQQLFALEGHPASVMAIGVSGDGQLTATAAADREVRVWSAASGKAVAAISTGLFSVRGLAFGTRDIRVAAFGIGVPSRGLSIRCPHLGLPSGEHSRSS